jgi:hypothetical protein
MEVAQMLAAHSILIKIFLGFLVLGIAIPFVTAKNPLSFRKGSFIYTMIFQAIATMVAFAGLVAVFTGDLAWEISTILMVAIWAIMMYIEIKKYKAIKLAKISEPETHSMLKSAFVKISVVQILLVVVMVVLMVLKAKGIVSI